MSAKCGTWPVGVCSWSFQKGIDEIGTAMAAMDVDHIQVALLPALQPGGEAYLEAVTRQGWTITSTMLNFEHEDYTTLETIRKTGGIAPDEQWPLCKTLFEKAAKLTAELKVPYITLHVGFLDHTDAAYAAKFESRVRTFGDIAKANGISLLMETGQETAEELERFLTTLNHTNIFLNFDPANLILYNTDEPIRAVKRLFPYIRHFHIKDAIRTKTVGTWGSEVPWGNGEVNAFAFLNTLKELGYQGPLAVEREAGNQQVKDIALAVRRLAAF